MNRVLEDDLKTIIAEDLSWEKLKNKTVMITGASGMVGSYMLYVLLMLNDEKYYGIKVDAVMRNVNKLPEEIRNREDVNVVVADVTKDIPDVGDVDYIIHAASPASPLIMQNQPVETIAANTIGVVFSPLLTTIVCAASVATGMMQSTPSFITVSPICFNVD